MKKIINQLLKEHFCIMLFVDDAKVYWLPQHHKYLSLAEMAKRKVYLGKAKNLPLKKGFNYITEPV